MLPDVTKVQSDITIVVPWQLLTGSKHDYRFCYCHLVGILFEVLRDWLSHITQVIGFAVLGKKKYLATSDMTSIKVQSQCMCTIHDTCWGEYGQDPTPEKYSWHMMRWIGFRPNRNVICIGKSPNSNWPLSYKLSVLCFDVYLKYTLRCMHHRQKVLTRNVKRMMMCVLECTKRGVCLRCTHQIISD